MGERLLMPVGGVSELFEPRHEPLIRRGFLDKAHRDKKIEVRDALIARITLSRQDFDAEKNDILALALSRPPHTLATGQWRKLCCLGHFSHLTCRTNRAVAS
jgi:hypothetical protein